MTFKKGSKVMASSLDTSIVFESCDSRRDMGLLLLKRKGDFKFELHLLNDYTNQAIAMVLELNDFAKMFDALQEYFIEKQIEI
jgi:hypothetical protein